MRARHIAHLHLHGDLGDEQYADVLRLLGGITSHVQAFPPDGVQLDLASALRYFDRSPYELVQMARMRLAALYGIETSAGLAGNRIRRVPRFLTGVRGEPGVLSGYNGGPTGRLRRSVDVTERRPLRRGRLDG